MRIFLFLKLILALFFLSLVGSPSSSFAQEKTPTKVKEFLLEATWEGERQAFWDWPREEKVLAGATPSPQLVNPPSGFLPGHPLYFLKTVRENLELALTFNPLKKEEKRLALAQERVAEINYLLEKDQASLVPSILSSYQSQILRMDFILPQMQEEALARHYLVLTQVVENAPEAAKKALEQAIEISQKGMDAAADAQDKSPLPSDFKTRIEGLKQQGFLSSEEITALLAVDSREQARKWANNLAKEGKIPPADIFLLNEKVKELAPEIFERLREEEKLDELKSLTGQYQGEEEKLEKVKEFLRTNPGKPIPPQLKEYLSLVRLEELKATIQADLLVGKRIAGEEFLGPGGCFDEDSCEAYCKQESHRKECLEFLGGISEEVKRKIGLPQDFQKYFQLMQTLGCTDEASCRAACQQNPQACRDFMPPGVQPGGPGGCKTQEECERYCQDPSHRADCLTLWQQYGFPPGTAEAEEKARQEGRWTPEEQAKHCQENPSAPDCAQPQFGPPPGEGQQGPPPGEWRGPGGPPPEVKGYFSQNKGPGGCEGTFSCWFYCLSPLNWFECRSF